jgi:small multidrug resistance pump
MPTHIIALVFAVMAETVATSALKASDQFTKLGPTAVVVVGYAISFYLLAYTVRFMPVGIVYALWSGMGIIFVSIIGWVWFKQYLDLPAILGLAMILGGIVVINVFSNTTGAH